MEFIPSGNKPKEPAVIDAGEFIGVKSFRAKGKRAGEKIASIAFGEPLVKETEEEEEEPVYSLDLPDEDTSALTDSPAPQSVSDSTDTPDTPSDDNSGHRAGEVVELNIDLSPSNGSTDYHDDDEPTLF